MANLFNGEGKRQHTMKIKWKIILALDSVLALIIILSLLTFQSKITRLVSSEASQELMNYSSLGLSLIDTYYPGDWSLVDNQLYKGDALLNEDYTIVDELSSQTGMLATIFAMDTRISTTVKDDKGERQIGTPASEKVIKTVITDGKSFQGVANINGKSADAYYVPLKDKDGKIIGMWFVGIYTDVIKKQIAAAMLSIVIALGIFAVIGTIASYFLGVYMAKGYLVLRRDLEKLENGNFNVQFLKGSLDRKDELGDITRSFRNMQEKVKDVISSIKEEAATVNSSSSTLADNAYQVHRDVEDISATTEQLSAGMEETSASSEEMNATTVTIAEEISRVTDKTEHGLIAATEIKQRAQKLKTEATASQKSAIEIYDNANLKLRASLEKASLINEIKVLSKSIMDITTQTNLLSLNASIESARAGEAGKGFAVVAHEISVLAQNSKKAVSQIDEISNDIAKAVEDIVEDSKLLLNFVDTKVIKDYSVLVNTSEQYDQDADMIESMVTEIKNSAIQLDESINYIRQAVEEVTTATTEGAKGSSDIAEKSGSIYAKTNEVLEMANSNKKIAQNLNELVKFFQV